MNNTLFLFDIDGTLTDPGKKIKNNMVNILKKLENLENVDIGIVGGSNLSKQKEQLGDIISEFKYIFSENGLVYYYDNELVHSQSIIKELGNYNYKCLVNICMEALINSENPIKRGNFLELRTGILNVSPIGRSCSYEERQEFYKLDKKNKYREDMIKLISKKWNIYRYYNENNIPELDFGIGGQISIDIYPKGWDKSYCLKFIEGKYNRIIFFGDRTFKGGNDYELFNHKLTEGYAVNSPDDTIKYINSILSSHF